MTKQKSLSLDAVVWVLIMVIAGAVAFGMLERDKLRHFGSVSYGGIPPFQLKTTDGKLFDEHKVRGFVWAIHFSTSANKSMDLARALVSIEEKTASGKRHMYVLTLTTSLAPFLKPLNSSHFIVLGSSEQIPAVFQQGENDNMVFLVDQDAVIRGKYDFANVDDYRRFQSDLLRIL